MSHEDSRLLDDATGLVQLTNEAETDFLVEEDAGNVSHGTWTQTASWDATATETDVFTATASWLQTASWSATASTPAVGPTPEPRRGAARIIGPARPHVARRTARAAWVQEPAGWRADMTYIDNDDWLVLDELLLVGAA
jgi:hypothetical protein